MVIIENNLGSSDREFIQFDLTGATAGSGTEAKVFDTFSEGRFCETGEAA